MENDSPSFVLDAIPNYKIFIENNNIQKINSNKELNIILDKFTIDDFKSILFLLMDELEGLDEFLFLVKKDKTHLKDRILEMKLEEESIIELLGTMMKFKDLKRFNTCKHLYHSQKQRFDNISEIWKELYKICETITDDDLKSLMEYIPNNFKNNILSAEEWFCYALKIKLFKENDFVPLRSIFQNNEDALSIINNFKGPQLKCYYIKTPTSHSRCGFALIFNFKEFSSSNFEKRDGSEVDIANLVNLWSTFGFEAHVFNNLTSSEVVQKLEEFAKIDHSRFNAFVCCLLSHGASQVIFASDCVQLRISSLINIISHKCETLKKKPKLFFIQACQGTLLYQTVGKPLYDQNKMQPIEVSETSAPNITPYENLPNGPDVFLVISTIDHCVSFRHNSKGSLFIEALSEVMLQCGHTDSIVDVITKVNAKVQKSKIDLGCGMPKDVIQIVPTNSTLHKKLILKTIF